MAAKNGKDLNYGGREDFVARPHVDKLMPNYPQDDRLVHDK